MRNGGKRDSQIENYFGWLISLSTFINNRFLNFLANNISNYGKYSIIKMKEIEVPKHLRQFMLEGAQATKLGDKKGAKKQYRYGNLHIREYDDKYTVHMDKYDPRSDPIRHLVWDAPEVLIGLAGAIIGGSKVGSYHYNQNENSKQSSVFSGLVASLITGYAAYIISKKLKE